MENSKEDSNNDNQHENSNLEVVEESSAEEEDAAIELKPLKNEEESVKPTLLGLLRFADSKEAVERLWTVFCTHE